MHTPVNPSIDQILSLEHAMISNESQQGRQVVEDYTVGEKLPRGSCDAEVPSSSSDQVHDASENSPQVARANDDLEQEMASENDSLVVNLADMKSIGNGEKYASPAALKSLLNHFMDQYLVRADYLFDSSKVDVEDDDDVMNMLRELATVDQAEQDLPVKHMSEVASTVVEDHLPGGEPKKLSFLQVLRKKLVHAGTIEAETFIQQFMQQNRAVLGKVIGKQAVLCTGNTSNRGPGTAVETTQSLGGDSHKGRDTTLVAYNGSGHNRHNLVISGRVEEETRREVKGFGVGDLVWAKVKSHPWWPGQVFDTADASVPARKTQKPGRVLVAFFGDGTFGWLQQSQLIAFRPNFEGKVKQTTIKSFCRAVSEALLEVGRRVELGLRCVHMNGSLYSKDTFPDENVGVRMGVRLYSHPDMSTGRGEFHATSALKFVRTTACSASYPLESGLECAELCGHLYGFRSFIVYPEKSMRNDHTLQKISVPRRKVKPAEILKRRVGVEDGPKTEPEKGAKRPHLDTDMVMEKQLCGSRSQSPTVQSPNIRAMESPLSKEADKSIETEEALRNPLLGKGKRVHASLEAGGGGRAKRLHSLRLVDNEGAIGFPSPEDDSKTLFDITGYLSLKKKKQKKKMMRGSLKDTSDMVSSSSKKFDQPSVLYSDEPSGDKKVDKLPVSEMVPSKIDKSLPEDSSNGHPCHNWQGDCEQEESRGTSFLLDKTLAEESSNDQPCLKLEGACKQEESRDTSLGIPKELHPCHSVSAFTKERNDAEEPKRGKDQLHYEVQDMKGQNKILKKKRGTMLIHAEVSNIKAKRVKDGIADKGRLKFQHNKEQDMKDPVKPSKAGESITKVESVFIGTPLSKKSANKSSAQSLVPVAGLKLKDVRRAELDSESPAIHALIAEKSTNSFVEFLNSLQGIARDPVSSADMKHSLHGVMSVFLKFRSMVFLKSAGYGNVGAGRIISSVGYGIYPFEKQRDVNVQSGRPGKPSLATQDACSMRKAMVKVEPRSDVECSAADVETGSSLTPTRSHRVTVGSQKLIQELAAMGKKADNEVLQRACLGQALVKREADISQGPYLTKGGGNEGKIGKSRHLSTSVKYHRAKSFQKVQVPSKAKFVVGIFMQFPEDSALPSEDELTAKFDRFGLLQTVGVRVHKDSSTAQVVFKHGIDAEAALLHAKQNKLFGHTNVSYKLRHFSPPSRSDSTMPSAKYGCSSVKGVKPLPSEESRGRVQVVIGAVSSGAQPGAPTMATHLMTVDTETTVRNSLLTGADQEDSELSAHASESHQQGAFQSGAVLPEEPSPTPQLGAFQAVDGSDVANFPTVSRTNVSPPPPPPPSEAAAAPPSQPAPPPPPGDIRDQMLNLLQQLSVLVSSSSLIH